MNILVTGGAGYIGSHTVVELISAGHAAIILDNFSNSDRSSLDGIEQITSVRPHLYEGDCCDEEFVQNIFEENIIDGIIHFAGLKSVGESVANPLRYYRNNIDSLITILKCAKQYGTKFFVFSSSATVYGEPDSVPIRETAERKTALSPYGNTKRICEDILRDTETSLHGDIHIIALRYFNPIGAHPSGLIGELPLGIPNNLVPYVTQTAIGKREHLTIFGDDYPTSDGTCIRDYIHVVDLAQAHIRTLEYLATHENLTYRAYNVGTGIGVSVKQLIATFEEVNGTKVPYVIGARRPGDIMTCYADPTSIRDDIGWQSKLSLADALRDAWNWEKNMKKITQKNQ
ncbi:MAG: UDP-glucose 4-epimerase GalE [Candidatus Moranbacteria bacterium]|nr:UDP-glucose 4-epimerase GalE [Candidatus Moranbacteria bacterium]MDD3964954.1 UDP-glucose 4-epimerase GalE [Candidatus Moranbacteria bacterium]